MKKLTYLFVAAAALGMVACNGNKPGYVITGTVEGAADGDTVFLQEVVGRQLSKLDTAIITKDVYKRQVRYLMKQTAGTEIYQ